MFFELEDHPSCSQDYVSVYDREKRIGLYCGRRYPEIVESTGNQMIVRFESNGKVERMGFHARYETRHAGEIESILKNWLAHCLFEMVFC